MSFRELYIQYRQNGKGVLVDAPVLPVCSKTGINIIEELEQMGRALSIKIPCPNFTEQDLAFYKMWLLDTDDFGLLVCYNEYHKNIASIYEPKKRREVLQRDADNGEFKKYAFMNIPKRFWGCSYDTMKQYPQQKQMLELAKQFSEGKADSLLLSSRQRGYGKTHIACCELVEYYVGHGLKMINDWTGSWTIFNSPILFIGETDLKFMIRSTYKDNAPYTQFDIYERLTTIPMLVIDDVYSYGNTEFSKDVVGSLIHKRVDENELPTILTTNCQIALLEKLDPSMASRLKRGLYISIDPTTKTIDVRSEK